MLGTAFFWTEQQRNSNGTDCCSTLSLLISRRCIQRNRQNSFKNIGLLKEDNFFSEAEDRKKKILPLTIPYAPKLFRLFRWSQLLDITRESVEQLSVPCCSDGTAPAVPFAECEYESDLSQRNDAFRSVCWMPDVSWSRIRRPSAQPPRKAHPEYGRPCMCKGRRRLRAFRSPRRDA